MIKNIQTFISNNLRYLLLIISLILIFFISFQTYSYLQTRQLKNTSIQFFDTIENDDLILENINDLKNDDNFYSILSKLTLIQKYNQDKNYKSSNELYKNIISSNELDEIYISSLCAQASYTLINASYFENTDNYFNDISFYISKISDDLQNYFSIKKELEYLLMVTQLDINNLDYKNNKKVIDFFNTINNSNIISSSVKDRVKKIHDFQIYK